MRNGSHKLLRALEKPRELLSSTRTSARPQGLGKQKSEYHHILGEHLLALLVARRGTNPPRPPSAEGYYHVTPPSILVGRLIWTDTISLGTNFIREVKNLLS